MEDKIVKRSWRLSDVTVKRSEDSKLITEIEGFAAVYGNVDSYNEIIDRGAFTASVAEKLPQKLIKLLADHDGWNCDKVIGLPVQIEDREMPGGNGLWGLWFRAMVSAAHSAQDVAQKVVEGIIDRCSVSTHTTEWAEDANGIPHNVTMELYDISIVPYAANSMAVITGARNDPTMKPETTDDLINRLRTMQPDELLKVRNALAEDEKTTEGVVSLANESEVLDLIESLKELG